MLVSDSVSHGFVLFCAVILIYVPWNSILNHVMTPLYSKTTLEPVAPMKTKQPKDFVPYRHVVDQNITETVVYHSVLFSQLT